MNSIKITIAIWIDKICSLFASEKVYKNDVTKTKAKKTKKKEKKTK